MDKNGGQFLVLRDMFTDFFFGSVEEKRKSHISGFTTAELCEMLEGTFFIFSSFFLSSQCRFEFS